MSEPARLTKPEPKQSDVLGTGWERVIGRVAVMRELALAKVKDRFDDDTEFWAGLHVLLDDTLDELQHMQKAEVTQSNALWDLRHPKQAAQIKKIEAARAKGGAR